MQTLTITVTDTDEVLEYFFSSRQGTFTPLTDATAVTSLEDDDALSGSLPVGFDFTFYGTTYSTLKASSNGFLTFNPAHTDPDLYENEIAGTSLTHAIMPFWDDLDGSTTGAQASYKVTGSSPNRVYTFEWLTFESVEGAGKISFQVSLHETSNMIELVYGPGAPGSPIDVSIGIKGVATDFFSLAGSGTSPMRSVGGTDLIATRPSIGQVYQFALTPPPSETNVAPVITSNGGGSTATVAVAENQTAVTTVTAMDADTGQTVTLALSGDDVALFSLSSSGALTFTTAPDYETPSSASGSNTYSVTVTATDDGTPEMSVMQTLTITVTDTDEVLEYFFSSRQGTFTPLTDATAVTSLADDDALSGSLPVGFDFTFYGTTYSTLKASSNGFLTFNPAHTDPDLYENEIAGTSLTHAIMPFWDDLDGSTTGAQASYKVTGSSPNRVYTFEWLTFESVEGAGKISFQVSLHETSNMIELVYGPGAPGSPIDVSIGIKGVATDFFSLAGSGTSPMRSVGGTDLIATRPSIGQVYQFALTPPPSETNVAPVITSNGGGSTATVAVAENQTAVTTVTAMDADTGQTVTLALSGDDVTLFSLSSSGALTFTTAPDYETPSSASGSNTYSVTVTATDDGTPEMSVMQTLTITVTDTDEVLEYFFSSRQGTFTPLTGATAVPSVADDDKLSGSLPVGFDFTFYGTTYSTLKASSNGFLTFDPAQSDSRFNNLIAGTELTYAIMPFWTDLDGSGAQASYKVTGSSPNRVYTFEWLNFESLVADYGQISFQVSLHETSNMIELVYGPGVLGPESIVSIGIKGAATDFFSLAGSGTSPMRSSDGEDMIATRPSIGQVYQFALTPPPSETNVAPVITSNGGGSTATVAVAENQTAVTTVTAMDADTGQTVTLALSGDDVALFSLSSSGALTFTTAPDYETPSSASGSNTYSVTVTATDDGTPEMSVMQTLTITVTDTDEVLEYFFSSRQGTFTPLTDATAVTSLEDDDALSGSLPVGFDFTFYGTTYSTLKASSNGFLTFNPAHTDPDLYENEIAGTSLTHAIMPFWDDLDGSTTGAQASYKVTGSSPNRVYTFEWLTFESVEGAGKISFQVSLHETSNMIELVYGPGAPGSPIDVSIGIKRVATDFFSLAGSGTSPMRSVSGINSISTRPANGQVYQFALTPPSSMTNAAPVITSNGGGSAVTVAVAENQTEVTTVVAMDADTGQTIAFTLSGDDAGLFSITPAGALTFTTAPDYETPGSASGSNTYSVTVTATDDGTPEMSVMQTLTITVTDEVLEYLFTASQGTFTPLTGATAVTSIEADDTVSESLPVGFDFTFYGTTYSTLKASSNGFLTFTEPVGERFWDNEIAGTSVATSVTYAIMPFWDDLDGSKTGAQASYKVTGSSPNRVYTFEWLNFESVNDNGEISCQVSLHETSNEIELVYGPGVAGFDASIGIKGAVDDFFSLAGSGTSPMRSLGGNDMIASKPADGQVYQFAPPPPSETNVAPVITSNGGGSTATVAVAENQTAVTTVTAMDADTGQTVTLALSGDDVALFSLSSSGELTFNTAPDYEMPTDAGRNNMYEVTVTATDDGTPAMTATQTLTVTVTDENEVVANPVDPAHFLLRITTNPGTNASDKSFTFYTEDTNYDIDWDNDGTFEVAGVSGNSPIPSLQQENTPSGLET